MESLKLYMVGGGVRDLLLGKTPNDIDFVIRGSSAFDALQEIAERFGGEYVVAKTTVPLVQFCVNGFKVEITLPRTEKKCGVGHNGFELYFDALLPIEDDLRRRDFTINAIALDIETKELIDPFGGLDDLRNRVIRHVSDVAFKDDPLRVIRALRFAANLGFTIAPETYDLMSQVSDEELRALPVERFTSELLKVKNVARFFMLMPDNVARVFMPELLSMKSVIAGPVPYHRADESVFDHSIDVASKCISFEAQLAGFFHDIGKIMTPVAMLPRHVDHEKRSDELLVQISERLKFPRRLTNILRVVGRYHMLLHQKQLRLSTYIKLAKILLQYDCVDIYIDVVRADGADIQNIRILVDAVDVAKKKPSDFVPVDTLRRLRDKASDLVLNRMVDALKARLQSV